MPSAVVMGVSSSVSLGQNPSGKVLPELLAPAGTWNALRAAVGAGADAVYLGGKRFSARQYAENFDDIELVRALEYAHRADVKVYVTVNTLLTDAELQDAAKFLVFLYEHGTDGVLVQDPGLIHLANRIIPDLPLHASTQMTIHNSAGVCWAQEMGLNRVVLARELTLQEITAIAGNTRRLGIDLEIFIHGALCFSYSGQCLFSSSIGGRSGNRGRCAQPCRKPYTMVHGPRDSYDRISSVILSSIPAYCLSTRDLCTYSHLDSLVQAPVTSLKIEGRMKSPEYVATVVRVYRRALDDIRNGSWEPRKEDIRDLLLAFNRGLTAGHLFGDSVMGAIRQDHQGLYVGEVIRYHPSNRTADICLSGETSPEKGDGVLLVSAGGAQQGMIITRPPSRRGPYISISCPDIVQPGTSIYITHRTTLDTTTKGLLEAGSWRQIPVDVEITWKGKQAILKGSISLRTGEEITVTYTSPEIWEDAKKQPLTVDQIERQIKKSGGTPYLIRNCVTWYPGGLFLPIGELNRIRRNFLDAIGHALYERHLPLKQARTEVNHQLSEHHPCEIASMGLGKPILTTYVSSSEGVRAAVEGGSDCICLQGGSDTLQISLPLCLEKGIPLVWMWPRIIREGALEEWISQMPVMKQAGVAGVMVSSPGIARAIRSRDPSILLRGGVDLNVWNYCTIQTYASLFRTVVLSPELSLAQIQDLIRRLSPDSPGCEIIVQGNQEVMISENCPQERIWQREGEGWGLL
ncbi:MAG: U32 family peptidase, partial [Methanomicrobiales archaeon]|nr:U32 family peptidase [Methanomicrobiales archaeon]